MSVFIKLISRLNQLPMEIYLKCKAKKDVSQYF